MEINENDILYKNEYITRPSLDEKLSTKEEIEFKKYYLETKNKNKKSLKENPESIKIITQNTKNDGFIPIIDPTTNQITEYSNQSKIQDSFLDQQNIIEKQITKLVSVDSRDRDKTLYPNANFFDANIGQNFTNVKSVKLISVEFPNTSSVINESNNKIYWRNLQDIENNLLDPITGEYPVYSVSITPGSYSLTSLKTAIVEKMNLVKRENQESDFHFFQVSLDYLTDLSEFTSLTLQQLDNNSFDFLLNSTLIDINALSHGFVDGETVYVTGAITSNGVDKSVLNSAHKVIYINPNKFQIEINVKANATAVGGGNTIALGKLAPFQLLFGTETNTIASNLGFPVENSSQRINTYILSIENFQQLKIDLKNPHNFSRSSGLINNTYTVSDTETIPLIDGNVIISDVPDSKSFLINSNNTLLDLITFPTNGYITVNGENYQIHNITNYTPTLKLKTFTNHNYEYTDIFNKSITLYSTTSTPSLDGENTIYGILNSTEIIIPGFVFQNVDMTLLQDPTKIVPVNCGNFPCLNPITTNHLTITGIEVGSTTKITCINHRLRVDDVIKFYNIQTTPQIISEFTSGIYKVFSVIDSDNFTINFETTSYESGPILAGESKVGTRLVNCFFPHQNFNFITSITSGGVNSANLQVTPSLLLSLNAGDEILISNSNSIPSIDGARVINSIISGVVNISLSFSITTSGDNGIVGLNNDFYIYGSTKVGGIPDQDINSLKFSVREIVDSNNIFFEVNNFSSLLETGGGNNIHISSLSNGFNGVQDNTKNDIVYRSINLEGENYVYICCKQLKGFEDTRNVKDIFAKIILDQSANYMVFNFINKEIVFEPGLLPNLRDFVFQIKNYDNSLYDFKDLDFSFTLEITTVSKIIKNTNENKYGLTIYK